MSAPDIDQASVVDLPRPRPHLRERLLSLSDLSLLPPVRPLVDGLLYRDSLAQISGPPGSYKSFVAVGLACSVALGRTWEGHRVPEAGPVVYIAAEGGSGIRTRVLAWCEKTSTDPADLDGRLYVLPEPLQLGNLTDVLQAREVVRELQALLVIVDTRARCTTGLQENDSTDQGMAIEAAESIHRASGATVLGIHHTGRSGDHGRGSNSWDGAVWSDLRLKGEDLRCVIHCEKHKDVPDGCDHHYRLVTHTVSEHLLPRLEDEAVHEWEQRRSTLVVVQNAVWTDDLEDRRSTKVVLDIIRTSAGLEGLTRPQLVDLAAEHNLSRSATYEAVTTLAMSVAIRNIGSEKRARWVLAGPSLMDEGKS
jgi:hypothetical protein